MIIQRRVEDALKPLLQKNIKLQVKDKVLKEGRFILFNIKDFYVTFTIRNIKDELKTYEAPLPFNVTSERGNCVFDYRFGNLSTSQTNLEIKIKCLDSAKKSKFYNTSMLITGE